MSYKNDRLSAVKKRRKRRIRGNRSALTRIKQRTVRWRLFKKDGMLYNPRYAEGQRKTDREAIIDRAIQNGRWQETR